MITLIITSSVICSAAFLGSLTGFMLKRVPERLNDLLTAFSAGIMLYAGITGLIVPAVEMKSGALNILFVCIGLLTGALFIRLISKLIPYIEKFINIESNSNTARNEDLMLFVLAIALHHLPEGMATGVSFGTGEISDVVTVTSGIAIQNFPEGMIIIPPMLLMGVEKKKVLLMALFSSLIEAVGTFTGYFLVNTVGNLLTFILAFAGGTILFVIFENMLPQIKENIKSELSSYAVLFGFCFMLILDSII